uniref:Uncharacterized protein n=1 Tax=Vitis vinifera TaxID=29760 RepID=A5BTE5_VITVI|nr:hypothetical protein VITISV_007169 [Vitis vinifera]
MAQPVEQGEEQVDRKLIRSRSESTPSSTGRGPGRPTAQLVEGELFNNLGFVIIKKGEIVKLRFRTNDYISSVIKQDDFQSGNHKDKSSQGEIMKKKTTSKRRVFQDLSFIRSLCKVVAKKRLNRLNRVRNRSTASSIGRGPGRPPAQPVEVRVDPHLNRSRPGLTPSSTG